ncbi:MAG: ATP-binding cassette domain-containing protein [Verrucomicrobiales bacterium]
MLELKDITYHLPNAVEASDTLLRDVSFRVPEGHFLAVVGPSGCGKTTLLKILAGILIESSGEIRWRGNNLMDETELEPTDLGYVPQFSVAYEHLTVAENINAAARLRVRSRSGFERGELLERVLAQTGLIAHRQQRVSTLSGGQRRRLGLAIELVSDPVLLLCDEVTTGLDPQAELEIVRLLHSLSRDHGRIVINVTHSLNHIGIYDSVLAMAAGRIAFHGPPNKLSHWFSAETPEDIYLNLLSSPAEQWHASWRKHHRAYYAKLGLPALDEGQQAAGDTADLTVSEQSAVGRGSARADASKLPGPASQFFTLLTRRWRLFFRDRVHLLLHLSLLIGFPFLVVIFASEGVGQMPTRLQFSQIRTSSDFLLQNRLVEEQVKTGTLISSLVLMQVVLLALMATNNAAREIAGERQIFEKEKLGGLRPGSYVMSKAAFLGVLVVVQSVWMGLFVHFFCRLPGDFLGQLALLGLVNAALTALCLGLSSIVKSPEQASLLGIYLAGFQLPLSGAVLRLPQSAEPFVRPFISAYWSWAGQLDTMKPSDFFIGIQAAIPSELVAGWSTCALVLGAHAAVGMWIAWIGSRRVGWE